MSASPARLDETPPAAPRSEAAGRGTLARTNTNTNTNTNTMHINITLLEVAQRLHNYDAEAWPRDAALAFAQYYDDLEADIGEESIEVDIVAIDCDWIVFEDEDDAVADGYSLEGCIRFGDLERGVIVHRA